jgi:hypothetical protein
MASTPNYRTSSRIRQQAATKNLTSQLSGKDLTKVNKLLGKRNPTPPGGMGGELDRAYGVMIDLPDVYQNPQQMAQMARQLQMPVEDLRTAMSKFYNAQ